MRRIIFLLVVLTVALSPSFAQEQKPSKVEIKASKVAGRVYMLVGPPLEGNPTVGDDGNIGVFVGDEGVVLVDDQQAASFGAIQATLKGISDKPLRFVINTHYHEDHVGANGYFQKLAPIIAPENLRKRMENGSMDGNGATEHYLPPKPKDALPILTFDHELTLHLSGEDIRVAHFPAAHTDGDAVVFFPKSNVVHMGDIFVTYGFPYIDLDAGGSVDGLIDAMEKVIAQLPADVKVMPGHGPVSSLEDMRTYLTMLKETREVVQKAMDQGKTLEQMREMRLLHPWQKYSRYLSEDAFLKTLYTSLKGNKIGAI